MHDGNERRYSGYDEYEGVFGPLGGNHAPIPQRSRSSALRSRRNRASTSDSVSQPRRSYRTAPNNQSSAVDMRAAYLRERRAKRLLTPVALDGDDEGPIGYVNRGGKPSCAPQPTGTASTTRQVWLPTQSFAFRQRAGKLDTRTIARLDVHKIVSTTDIDTIQVRCVCVWFAVV